MKNGSYWINDKNRYGWEVVRVMNNKVYRFGMDREFSINDPEFDRMIFIETKSPKERECEDESKK